MEARWKVEFFDAAIFHLAYNNLLPDVRIIPDDSRQLAQRAWGGLDLDQLFVLRHR